MTLEEVIRIAIENRLSSLHIAMPGQVVSHDPQKNCVSVQPVLKRKYESNDEVVKLPVINNVPVVFPRAGNAYISLPISAGDVVQLLFSERSIDLWKAKGGVVDPDDPRKFHLSDAVAIPGGYPLCDPVDVSTTDIRIHNDIGQVSVLPTGKFQLKNTQSGNEVLDLVYRFCDAVKNGQVICGGVPGTWDPETISTMSNILAKLATLKV